VLVVTGSALLSVPGWCGSLFEERRFDVAVTRDVVYGWAAVQAPTPGVKELLLDLYEPVGDGAPELRPALLAVHGGGFRGGDKAQANFVALCEDLASRGYLCASINYRLEKDDPPTQGADLHQRAIAAAIEDAGTALVWLHDHAEEYRIDHGRIAAGGGSAGAITTLFLVYRFGDPDYPVGAVLDLWGGLYDSVDAIDPGEPPIIIVHGTEDRTVPFSLAEAIVVRAAEVGVAYELYAVEGAGHGVSLGTEVDGVVLYDAIAALFFRHLELADLSASDHSRARVRRGPGVRHTPDTDKSIPTGGEP
jgi:acetyl esterase/lipase